MSSLLNFNHEEDTITIITERTIHFEKPASLHQILFLHVTLSDIHLGLPQNQLGSHLQFTVPFAP